MAGHGGSIGPDLLILPGTVITQRAEQTACAGSLCWTPTKGGRRRDLSTPGSPLATPTSPALRQKSNKSKRWDGDRLAGGDGDGGLPPQQHPQHLGDGQPSWISEAMQSTGAIPLPGRGNKPLLPLGTDTGCVCSQAERRGVRDASPPSTLRSQAVNGEFHGCGTAERGREHAGAICSQDLRLSSRPDLGKANNLQEQMSHPPFPPGLWVYHALGSAPPQTPGALGWSLAPSWGHNQRAKLQRPGNLTAGVTPPKMWDLWESGHGTVAERIPAPSWHPGHHTQVPPHRLPSPVPVGKDLASPQSFYPATPPAMAAAHKGAWLCHHPHLARGQRCRCSRSRPDPGWFPAGPREWLAPVSFGLIKIHSA